MKKAVKIAVLVIVISTILIAVGCSGGGESGGVPAPGKKAPSFELKTLDGETISLESLRGRPVLVNFWATYCMPCRVEMPVLQQIQESPEWRARGLAILAVNIGEPAGLVRSFVEVFDLSFTVLIDSSQIVTRTYNAALIPTTYFINKDGIINEIKVGAIFSIADIEPKLRDLVAVDGG